jgi:hypothetical protein
VSPSARSFVVGKSDGVEEALCKFAQRYADQTEADHVALVAAVDRGLRPVERGVQSGLIRAPEERWSRLPLAERSAGFESP